MADISKQEDTGFLQQGDERKKAQRSDGSVLLDMEGLSLLVGASNTAASTATEAGAPAPNPSPHHLTIESSVLHLLPPTKSTKAKLFLQKTLSRKFSPRGDRKVAPEGGDNFHPTIASAVAAAAAGRGGAAVASTPVSPATDKFVSVVLPAAATSEATPPAFAAATSSPRQGAAGRRAHGRRSTATSPWLDPRRVLLFFATLSSMGTIILLYFTLSMGRMGDSDADAR